MPHRGDSTHFSELERHPTVCDDSTAGQRVGPSRRTVMKGALGLGLVATATTGTGVLPLPRAAAAGELLNAGFEQVTDGWPTE